MSEENIIKKGDSLQVISWEGVVEVGHKVKQDINNIHDRNFWISNAGYEYHNGYVCIRNVYNKTTNNVYKVTCSINSSLLKKPLFCCSVEFESSQEKFTAKNPTTVMKKVFNFIGVNPTRVWNGNEFFGLYRKDVQSLLATAIAKNITTCADQRVDILTKESMSTQWVGVISLGDTCKKSHMKIGKNKIWTPPGYEALRKVKYDNKSISLYCKIEKSEECSSLHYTCYTKEDPVISSRSVVISKAVSTALKELSITSTRRWSGVDFFGLTRSDVITCINAQCEQAKEEKAKKKSTGLPPVLKDVLNIRHRNAGPTSNLCEKSQRQRNELIHQLVSFASSGDVRAYISHLCQNYMDVIDDALENSNTYLKHFIEARKISTHPVDLSCSEAAELLLGRCDLSQRGYKNLRSILKKNNVSIPSYGTLREYCSNLNVGRIYEIHDGNDSTCECMGVGTDTKETLQLIVSNKKLFERFNFLTHERQAECFEFLKSKNAELYSKLDASCRTIVIRSTGDNFRASARMPTEQTSFSILNIKELSNNPYGQFISTLWRGSESREMIEKHVADHYNELLDIVKNGIELFINNTSEYFNIVCFFVADLCFVKDVIGQCSCASMYGCYHCYMKNTEWNKKERKSAKKKTMTEMSQNGVKAVNVLGKNPVRASSQFTNFQQSHGGQWTSNLFPAFITELMPPCGLHLILANHRYIWKFLFDVLSKRNMENLIPKALRTIGCGYLAYQVEQYHKSKKKQYDGSESLKMIGNDCKLLEENIDTFLDTFIRKDQGETWESRSSLKLKQILVLYNSFADLARDVRSVTVSEERISTFNERAEKYFTKFITNASSTALNKLPYLHYLRDHLGDLMMLHSRLFGFGYGVFCCHAGEHLNKLIKTSEMNDTNLDKKRFFTVTHLMRVKQFIFTDVIMKQECIVKCSVCGEIGHNRKNKSCPLHPSHPAIEFDDSDTEV